MTALARRVPLTLLADLADPAGPDSRGILDSEAADLSWLGDLAFAGKRRGSTSVGASALSAPATG